MSSLTVHWLRHGHIASHRGDIPLTDKGLAQARDRGRSLAAECSPGERVHFLHAPTLRTLQTVEEVRKSLSELIGGEAELLPVREEWAIRSPDIYVSGQRVEMVSDLAALAEQLSDSSVPPETLGRHPFFREFWDQPDRIGYWVGLADPPGEDAAAVARRQIAFATSLADISGRSRERYVLSTHSPVLRAILAHYLGEEPGEPEYLESVDLTGFRRRKPISFSDGLAGANGAISLVRRELPLRTLITEGFARRLREEGSLVKHLPNKGLSFRVRKPSALSERVKLGPGRSEAKALGEDVRLASTGADLVEQGIPRALAVGGFKFSEDEAPELVFREHRRTLSSA